MIPFSGNFNKKPLYMPMLSSFGGGSARGFNPGGGGGGVNFSSFTFTNARTYGNYGPTLSQAQSVYDTVTYPFINDSSIYDVTSTGVQKFVVPKSGTYRFTARSAVNTMKWDNIERRENTVFVIQGDASLSEGDILWIAVGQIGANDTGRFTYGSGPNDWANAFSSMDRDHITATGPGGTFVGKGSTLANASPVIVSGAPAGIGGSAASNLTQNNMDANQGQSAYNGNLGEGGSGGNGGSTNDWGARQYGGGGGGGFYTGGQHENDYGKPGSSFISGALGGAKQYATVGGFGGGGSGQSNDEPAGGGGYSGGGGGGYNGDGSPISQRYGGGGGSYYQGLGNVSTTPYTPSGYFPEFGYMTLEAV